MGRPLLLRACVREHRLQLATLSGQSLTTAQDWHPEPVCWTCGLSQGGRGQDRGLRGLPSGAHQKVAPPALLPLVGVA